MKFMPISDCIRSRDVVHIKPFLSTMLHLWALPSSQSSTDQMVARLNDVHTMCGDLVTLGMHYLSTSARSLRVGASLPSPPARVSAVEVANRIQLIRGLPKEPFAALHIQVSADAFQHHLSDGGLVREGPLFKGTLPRYTTVDICMIKPWSS